MIDFTDKNVQVELNQDRLKEEYERYHELRSRIGILSIFYSIFAAYSVQLIKFALSNANANWGYIIVLFFFLLLFGISVFFAILLLIPKKVAFKETPRIFYHDVYNNYKNKSNIPEEHIKYYIRETYLKQIEKALENNYRQNNKISKFHYYAFTFALLAIIPYLVCVGIKLTKDPEEIQKVELINSVFKRESDPILKFNKKEVIMQENEESNQQGQENNTNQEPDIDPDNVIRREPELIKENEEFPDPSENPLPDDTNEE